MLSTVPTGLTIRPTVPTDKSVDYFHLSLLDKMHIRKKVEIPPSLPKIFYIEFDVVLFEKVEILILKIKFLMVIFLVFNIHYRFFHI